MNFLVTMLLFTQTALAAPAWWARTCEYLIEGQAPRTSRVELNAVYESMSQELSHNKRYSDHQFTMGSKPIESLVSRQEGVEIHPTLSAEMIEQRPVSLKIFANPSYMGMNWSDAESDLAEAPALLIFFEDIPVRNSAGKEVALTEIMEEEFAGILEANSNMHGKLNISKAGHFGGLTFRETFKDFKVAWIDGELKNFQIKRSTLLVAEKAYARTMEDLRYAIKAPPKAKH